MKNRIIFVSLVLCLASLQLSAQAKIRDVVTSDYNRNSVSFITIQRGDSNDSSTASAVSSFNPGEKFDINSIKKENIADSQFRFNAKDFPKAEVVDLR